MHKNVKYLKVNTERTTVKCPNRLHKKEIRIEKLSEKKVVEKCKVKTQHRKEV